MFRPLALLAALIAFSFACWAQEPSPPTRTGIWRAELPGGIYMVRLSTISSVSQHEYAVGATMKVTEVNIVTPGNALVRFYVIEPIVPEMPLGVGQTVVDTATSLAKDATEHLGASKHLTRVTTDYPATTHAHTIEYRLEKRDDLDKLFDHVSKAWTEGRGGTFRLQQ